MTKHASFAAEPHGRSRRSHAGVGHLVRPVLPLRSTQRTLLAVILLRLRLEPLQDAVHVEAVTTRTPHGGTVVAGELAIGTERTERKTRSTKSQSGGEVSTSDTHIQRPSLPLVDASCTVRH